MKHSPTKAMQNAAKRGLVMMKEKGLEADVPEVSQRGGKKIASGQQISDDHVRSMAQYHAGHSVMGNGCPTGDDAEHADDLMWGGPAGAGWSAARVAALDATSLAESDSPDITALLAQDNSQFSMEIFSNSALLDRTDLQKDEEGLIWAPIIRSGTLACRPGPNGTKQHKPLVFVAGRAKDPSKEIGLEDLVDAFNERAVEHVTIPETHANTTLENTGKIVKVKLADSTLRKGEKVILAGHKFTEPEVEEKVERGSIISRSCGILHNYTNTETGRSYPHVIEHVALTNKPWVTGMEPYGSSTFSDQRPIIPMLLSEEIVVPPPAEPTEGEPRRARRVVSTSTPLEDLERELRLADVQWGDEPSLRNIERQLYQAFRDMGRSPDYDEPNVYFSIMDVTPNSALVRPEYEMSGVGLDDYDDAIVVPFSIDDQGVLHLSDFAQWKFVEQKWVTDDDAEQDKQEVQQALQEATNMSNPVAYLEGNLALSEADLNLATLTSKQRKKLSPSSFVFPDTREYPIHDLAHARNALARGAQNETGDRLAKIRAAVYKKYPQLKKSGDNDVNGSKSNMSLPSDPLKRASMLRLSTERPTTQQQGGAMTLTRDMLERLNLDDTTREVLQREVEQTERDQAELRRLRDKDRTEGTRERIRKLSEVPVLKDQRGFLREVERVLLADDGDVAIKLNLAEDGHPADEKHMTMTQVVDRLISSLTLSQEQREQVGKIGSLLDNPLDRRPDLEPEKTSGEEKPKTGDQLLAEWRQADPNLHLSLPAAKE